MNDDSLRKSLPFFCFLLFFSVFLLLVDYFGWFSGVKGWVERPFLVLERPLFLVNQSFVGAFDSFGGGSRSEEVVDLQTQLRQLAVDQNQLVTCLEENEKMRKLLGTPLPPNWQFKMSRVIGLNEKLKIDLGRKAGVEEEMMVVSENIYLGRVVSIGEDYNLVQLPTDLNSKIPVVVKKPGGTGIQAKGLLIGQFGESLLLDRVLQEEDIRQGDLVVTSGEEGYLPDLVIGQIKEVKEKTAEVYQQAIVTSLIDYSSLRLVFVVFP
ncbi:MAG: rod shape-determining protein MreC [Candidatus Marinimicrobia bacterium]|nr:rod shape-determining protein MreC [Candidatus Neomarinimicrobiota bacterium]